MAALSIEDINRLDLVDFLASIDIHPKKISGHLYLYHSPFADGPEKTLSFKVNRKTNRWWDTGIREGSTLADFGVRYFTLTIREFDEKLSAFSLKDKPVPHSSEERNHFVTGKIDILKTYTIRSFYLTRYLWERRIPLHVAQRYCVEVNFSFVHAYNVYYAIGFQCDQGGYMIRDKYRQFSSSPQSPTLLLNQSKDLAVFTDFFDMLSFVSFIDDTKDCLPDLLVLNDASFFQSFLSVMDTYRYKHLFLENDLSGDKYTAMAIDRHSTYLDHRGLYKGYKGLNEWTCHIGKTFIPMIHSNGG